MKKTTIAPIAGIGAALFLLSACGAEAGGEGNTATESTSSNEKQSITVYSAGPEGLAEDIKTAFVEETGIQVDMFQGTTGKILSRLEAESNNPVADVVVLASVPSMEGLKSEGMLQPYEAKNGELMNQEWSDSDHYYYGYSASALGVAYNTNQVDNTPGEWTDFSDPEWANRVTMPDPTSSGSAVDFLYGLTSTEADGWEWIEGWIDNGLLVAGANKESLDAVITGDKDVVVSAVDYMAYKAKASGEPIEIYYPESGTVISPRAAGVLADATNVSGAQAYIDFLLSDKAQQLVADAYLLPGNEEIALSDRASLSEIPVLPVTWEGAEEKQIDTLNEFTSKLQQ